MQRRELNTLRTCGFVRIFQEDFSLRRLSASFSVRHELFGFVFMISEANTFRQGKVVKSKSASFTDHRHHC